MSPHRRHRRLPLLHVFVQALFALALVLQPALTNAGEMHELAHDSSGMHAHALHVDNLHTEMAAAGEQDDDGAATLHVLLHFAHAGDQVVVVLPTLRPLAAMPLTARRMVPDTSLSQAAPLASPFKPPIVG